MPLLLTTVVVLLLYRFVPARRLSFGDALAGAIVTAILLLAISLASSWILERAGQLSVVYGSLTAALVIFLYSVYLYASALLLGAEVAAAWSHPGPPIDESLRSQGPPGRSGPVRPPGAAVPAPGRDQSGSST